MAIVIDRDLIDDIDEPSFEVLAYVIKKHQEKLERYDKLDDYYNGKHAIDDRERQNSKAPNTKVTVNYAKYITDVIVGFVFGNEISYTPGYVKSEDADGKAKKEAKNIDAIIDFFDKIEISAHDAELGKDLSVFGETIELIYTKVISGEGEAVETMPMIKVIDPRGAFIVTDDTIDKEYLFGVHYQKKFGLDDESTGWQVDVYTPNAIRRYKTKTLEMEAEDTEEIDVKENVLGEVQMNEIRNNEERQGDFEQQISLIDANNNLQSDRISDKEAFIDAILILYGFRLAEGETLGADSILEAPKRGGEDGAFAEYLTKAMDEADTQTLADSIVNDIHKTSFVPDMSDEQFAGNTSGVAMQYKLFGLLQLLTVKSRYLTRGLRRRLMLLQKYYEYKKVDCDVEGVDIQIRPNLPVNTIEILQMVVSAKDVLSLKTLLKMVPFIDDPEEEVEKLIKQKIEDIKLNRLAFGEQSHNEPVETPEEDEDDTNEDNTKE